jgi:alkylation response protein AidB-like acyl-CoA dehydrogenase
MATALKGELLTLRNRVARFAEQHLACRDDLHTLEEFPQGIWQKMSEEGLLGVGLPVGYGGLGGDYLCIAVAGETLLRGGRNAGIALSWLIHNAVSRFFILGFGNEKQQDMYLRGLASGNITAAIAVSEPGRGAHPKHVETSADREGDCYVLRGQKTFITNGPIADLFVVVAVSRLEGGRKRFTAFLVPRDAPGLSVTEPMNLDFLRPSPHGGIVLSDCRLPASSVLGVEGSAYEDMARPFRQIEETLAMSLAVGGMGAVFDLTLNLLRKPGHDPKGELKTELGQLHSLLHTLRIVSYEAASLLDDSSHDAELPSLLGSFGDLSGQFRDRFELLTNREGLASDPMMNRMTKDMLLGGDRARRTALIQQRKLGERLLSGKERDEIVP